ncbi:MAG: bifunctional alpha/beta hydrolase/OsmC family protein, partial [Pseudomonadota bacterium]
TNSEGNALSGVVEVPSGPVKAWAIFAHCFTCSKTGLAASRIARYLTDHGIGVLRFDFTGLGESDGDFAGTGFSTNVQDLIDAVRWMDSQARSVTLMIGHSLGGAASVVAASKLPDVRAVATVGAPSDAEHVIDQFSADVPEIEAKGEKEVLLAGRLFVVRKSFLVDVRGARVSEAAATLKKPLLVMHSPIDQTVSIENATGLFLAAKHPKSFVSLDKADHLLTGKQDAEYVASVIAGWAGRYLAPHEKQKYLLETGQDDIIVRETRAAGPFQNEIRIGQRRFLADEPESVGGGGTGPDPYELVTAGLGACTSMTLRMYADRKGWPLERVTVNLSHEKTHPKDCVDCGPRDRIDTFTRSIFIEGDLDEAQRQRLLEIADKCPVHRTLEAEVNIETRLAPVSA